MIKDEQGYTLVELVISMAMLAVVSGAILLFMMTGSNSYSYAKTELDLQKESQTLMAQLNTMILECNNAVYDASKNTLTLYEIEDVISTDPITGLDIKTKTITDKKVIFFSAGNSSLYLQEFADDSTPTLTANENNLFANYINNFTAVVDKNKVTVNLDMKCKKQKYQVSSTTKIRNKLVALP